MAELSAGQQFPHDAASQRADWETNIGILTESEVDKTRF